MHGSDSSRITRRVPGHWYLASGVGALALLLAAACGSDDPAAAVAVRDSAGITIVENDHTRPAWGREEGWRLAIEPAIQVGNIFGNFDHSLYQVSHSQRLASGGIVVANAGMSDVRVYDADGVHVRTIRLSDEEAAVAARPLRVYELPADSLLVIGGDGSVRVFDGQGEPARSSTLEPPGADLAAPALPIGMLDDGSLVFRARHSPDSTWRGVRRSRARILRYASSGALLGALGDFDNRTVLYGAPSDGRYIFGAAAHEAAGDSTVWYGAADRFELREVASDGETVRLIRLDRPSEQVTGADVFAYRQGVIGPVRGTELESTTDAMLEASEFADTFPAYGELIVDDVGNLWVRSYQWLDLGGDRAWTVFDREGRYLGEVATPSKLEIHQIGDDFVLGRMADGSGAEAVYIYGLEKPLSAARSGGGAPDGSERTPG